MCKFYLFTLQNEIKYQTPRPGQDSQNVRDYRFITFGVVLIVWEVLPTFMVLWFFRVRRPHIGDMVIHSYSNIYFIMLKKAADNLNFGLLLPSFANKSTSSFLWFCVGVQLPLGFVCREFA